MLPEFPASPLPGENIHPAVSVEETQLRLAMLLLSMQEPATQEAASLSEQ